MSTLGTIVIKTDQILMGSHLYRLVQAMQQHLERKLLEVGYADIRSAHFTVFNELESGGSRISDMAARAGITKQSMSFLVETLETLGYLERVPDPSDGRAKLVRYTPKGSELFGVIYSISKTVEEQWRSRMDRDFSKLEQLLERLSLHMDVLEGS